ncbi:MAG: aspartate aminotransferase family protein [Candidatus Omnitrophica bacterium]|nr:aspartate aminotransferase family protein [Candidatus Omnitrophota bacterium]MBU4488925.1 aspartate aminotransferase family protein [Candidatus Omnitrophota bacterium]MCG2705321.1 aspartate aminotransferase family protein [Candidatus Omnitrophota bacterium]
MTKTELIKEKYDKYVMPTYARDGIAFAKGKGITLWDADGKEYLDFFPGWAVSGIGHCHSKVVAAIREQAGVLIHVSNNYYSELQAELAKKIIYHAFPGKVFFGNSGAEANECAVKLARKYGSQSKRYEIITMEKSFHGRTIAMITATGQDKVKHGFEPLLEGFKTIPFNDLAAVKAAVTEKTVAIMIEPIQGEGGINAADKSYIEGLRKLCDEKDMLLIFDEVQTAMGRTGEMFAFKNYNVQPDIMTLAKSLGSGVPIGATVASSRIADTLTAGTHASTFGGSPIVSAAALATFEAIEKEGLLENARDMGAYLREKLEGLKKEFDFVKKIKGIALMIGVELSIDGKQIFNECRKRGLLINCTQGNILRIMPPLTVKKEDIDKAIKIIKESMATI